MRISTFLLLGLVITACSISLAHDLFIKPESYFLPPESSATFPLLNGTFSSSDGAVAEDRISKILLSGPDGTRQLANVGWTTPGDTTYMSFAVGAAGTYTLGVSTRPRLIELEAQSFNEYLRSDGIPDVLEARRRSGELQEAAVERYSKHVKAVYQVGDSHTKGWNRALGFPAEIVPLENPYELTAGRTLRVLCLVHGEPVENQLVIAGGEGSDHEIEESATRTDDQGIAEFVLDRAGKWYIKFIHMVNTPEPDLDYESNWATISFEIRR